jgi:hypothetical protein
MGDIGQTIKILQEIKNKLSVKGKPEARVKHFINFFNLVGAYTDNWVGRGWYRGCASGSDRC